MLEIAAAAGVSRSTVSNVMRGRSSVAEDVKRRVLDHASRLGYVYNRGAASLRMRQSHLVGLVIPDIANPFIAEAVRGAHEVLSDRGYLVATIETADDADRQALVLRSLAEHRVDGFLLLPALGTDVTALRADLGGLPTVMLNRDIGATDLEFVGPEEGAVARVGAEHLIGRHNSTTVAYFGGSTEAQPRIARARAFEAYATSHGATMMQQWSVPCDPTPAASYELAVKLIATGQVPMGIQCHSDSIAYGLLRALREAGITPEQCRVLGCDDLPDSAYWNPSVTSISVDSMIIGRTAASRLLLQLGGTGDPVEVPPPHLITRASCGEH
ncbi:MAG: hypothetical protein JWP85_2568 [Rhodoglobus sp.]|nr:hypothetical protein [Rhodoglobus sp.]